MAFELRTSFITPTAQQKVNHIKQQNWSNHYNIRVLLLTDQ